MSFEKVGVEVGVRGRTTAVRDIRAVKGEVSGIGSAAERAGDQGRRSLSRMNSEITETRRRSNLARGALRGLAFGVAGIAAGVGAAGFAAFRQISQGFEGLAAQEAAAAQVRQGIKTTGGVANVSARQLGRYADRMERLTGIEAERVQDAQATLLTFTSVRNEQGKNNKIFDQAIGLAADLSTRFGTDLKGSALQVGKALNDPVKGITALSRVGVSFTEQQKEQIKNFVESGETMKAQKVILRELETQVGGSARAQGRTWDGLKARVGNAWGNIQESIAGSIDPLVREWLPKLQDKFNEWADWIHDHRGDIRRYVTNAFDRLGEALRAVGDWWNANGDNVKSGLGRIGEIAKKYAPYMDEMVKAYLGWKTVSRATSGIKAAADAMTVLKIAMVGAKGGGGLVAAIGTLGPILAGFTGVVASFGQAWKHARLTDEGGTPGRSTEGQLDHVSGLINNPGGQGAPKTQSPHAEADALAGVKALRMSRGGDNIATGWVLNGVSRGDAEHIANKVAEAVARRKADR